MSGNKNVFLTFTFIALVGLSFEGSVMLSGLNSGIALFLENEGHPAALAGFLMAVFTAASTVARILTGDMTDHVNHEKFLLIGVGISLCGTMLPIVSDSVPVIALARAIQGVGFCILTTVTTVLVAEFVPRELLGTGQGYKGVGNALGTAIGPTVAVFSVGLGGGRGLHIAVSILCFIGLLLAIKLRTDSMKKEDPIPDESDPVAQQSTAKSAAADMPAPQETESHPFWYRFLEPKALPPCFTEFFRRAINGACASFIVLYGLHLGIEQASLFFVIAAVAILTCRLFGGKWMDTANGYLVMGVMCGSCIVGFLLAIAFPYAPVFALAGFMYGIEEGLGSPYIIAQTIRFAPEGRWGVASSDYFLFGDAGNALGAWICGMLIDAFDFGVIPWFAIAATALTFATGVILRVPGNIKK